MGKLRDIVGDDPAGYATAIAEEKPNRSKDPEVEAQLKRYQQECGPVTTMQLIEWCVPYVSPATARRFPCCGLHKSGLTLNALALELLGFPPRVRVGVMATGELIVRPAKEEDPDAYRVSYGGGKRKRAATIGRQQLSNWLQKKGLQTGHYRLERDEKLGMFVGRRLVP